MKYPDIPFGHKCYFWQDLRRHHEKIVLHLLARQRHHFVVAHFRIDVSLRVVAAKHFFAAMR